MPSKMHSFTRFLRRESSHFRRKVMAKLLRDEKVPSRLRNIANVLNGPCPVFRFLQVLLLGVFIAMTVMAWVWSSMKAHHSVTTVSNDLQGYQINNMKLNMALILESTIVLVLLLVVVIPHNGVWGHITTSSLRIWTLLISLSITIFIVTITFVCFLTEAVTKVLQLCATLIQQLERMSSNKRMAFAQEYVDKELWVKYGQLQQRLSNLLSNALQFTAEGEVVVCFWTKQGVPRKSVPTKLQDSCFQTFRELFKGTYIYRQINAYFDAKRGDNYILEISGRKSKRDSQVIESRTQPRCSPVLTQGDEDGVLKIMGKNQKIRWQKPLSGRNILVSKVDTVSQKIAKLKELGACADCVDKDADAIHLVSERFQNSQGSALSKEIPSSYCEAKKNLHSLKGLAGRQALTQGVPVQKRVAITPHCTEPSVRVHIRGRAHHTFAVDNVDTHSEFDQETHLQKLEAGWCDKIGSVDEIQKKERRRREATSKSERARSYALTHLAKKSLHALKGLAGLQALTQGEPVQKQLAITPHCIESSVRVHARGRARHMSAVDNLDTHSGLEQKTHLQKLEGGWCDQLDSIDEIQKERRRKEGTSKCERAKSYALTHQAKKALHSLKGLAGRQALTQGKPVQEQVAITSHCIESSIRVHARGRTHHTFAVDNLDTHSEFDQKAHLQKLEAGWCDKLGSVDEIWKKERRRQEAASKRERARSYALTHQWQPHSRINCKKSSRPKSNRTNTGCKSLERQRATHPWEIKRLLDEAKVDGYKSISSNNSTMTCGQGGSHLVGNGKECAIGSNSQSERKSSLISLLKARVHQKYSSIQPKANQEAEVRKHF